MINIKSLEAGSFARIISYNGVNDFTERLQEMGLIPGTTFKFVRKAPLGGPFEISFGQSRIGIRSSSDVEILVERLN